LNLAFANYLYQNADFVDTALDTVQYTHQYWIFLMPLILAGADIVTGWIQASINATWDSTKMRKGLFRKGGELLVVVLAFVTEYALEVAAHAHIATFASVYIIVMESLSVLENLDQAGVPIPPIIRDRLGKVKHDMDGGADNA
jgi:toxin secretion/phage lysis holin